MNEAKKNYEKLKIKIPSALNIHQNFIKPNKTNREKKKERKKKKEI